MKALSPTQLALLRLAKNRLAIAGGVLVLFMGFFCLLGPLLVEGDAVTTRLWLGAQPPLFTHPASGPEVVVREGEQQRGLECGSGAVEIRWQERQQRELRIVLRRSKVTLIQYSEGARRVKEVTIDGKQLIVGQKPPAGLFAPGQRVLIHREESLGPVEELRFVLDEQGVVGQLQTAVSLPVDKPLYLRAKDILDIKHNGDLQTQRHLLGTDELGRDLLLRIMQGGRVSLLVGVVATLVALVIGVLYGAVAGYRGGYLDRVMMGAVDVLYALPFIFLVLLLMVVFDRNIFLLFLALGMVQWLTMARIVRAQVLSLVTMDYIQAARISGAGGLTILLRHIIPHTIGPVIVFTTLMVPTVILEESFLAFIGLPVQYQGTTLDSWGSLVHQGSLALGDGGQNYWLLIFPSLAMIMTLFGLNALGDGLRDAFDPKGELQ